MYLRSSLVSSDKEANFLESLKSGFVGFVSAILAIILAPFKMLLNLFGMKETRNVPAAPIVVIPPVITIVKEEEKSVVAAAAAAEKPVAAKIIVKKATDPKSVLARKYAIDKLKEIDESMKAVALKAALEEEPGRWPPNVNKYPDVPIPKKSVSDLADDELKGKR